MFNYRLKVKIVNTKNDKLQEFYLPVNEEILKEKIGIQSYNDENLLILSIGRSAGKSVQDFFNASIQRKDINIKQFNEIGKLFSKYDIEKAIIANALTDVGKIKKWQDFIKLDKELNKYMVIFYGTELEKEKLGNYIYNSFPHKKPIYERSTEYKEKLVDDFHSLVKGKFTKYGYLVKDFDKIKAKCTNKGFELIEKSETNEI